MEVSGHVGKACGQVKEGFGQVGVKGGQAGEG